MIINKVLNQYLQIKNNKIQLKNKKTNQTLKIIRKIIYKKNHEKS